MCPLPHPLLGLLQASSCAWAVLASHINHCPPPPSQCPERESAAIKGYCIPRLSNTMVSLRGVPLSSTKLTLENSTVRTQTHQPLPQMQKKKKKSCLKKFKVFCWAAFIAILSHVRSHVASWAKRRTCLLDNGDSTDLKSRCAGTKLMRANY